MSFKIAELRAAEIALANAERALTALRENAELKRELEFDRALDKFLAEHLMNRAKLQAFLTMQGFPPRVAAPSKPGIKPARKPVKKTVDKPAAKAKNTTPRVFRNKAPAKVYKNPHNNETITVKRVDHGVLKRWVAEHGQEVVDSWLVV